MNSAPASFDWIAHHATNRPDAPAAVDLATNRSFTYAEMNDRTSRLAAALAGEFGIGHGDRVAVLANNNTNTFEVQFACWKLGAIFVPLNWRLTIPELEFIVGDCAPTVMIHDHEFAEAAATLAASPGIPHRICWDPVDPARSHEMADYEELLRTVEPLATAVPTTHDDVLTIMYTSGTTGRPKGAMITQGMTFWNAVNVLEFYQLSTSMVNLAFLPLFHTGGLNTFSNPSFHMGGSTVVMRSFDPAEALRLLCDEASASPTSSVCPPTSCS
ncbi:MAG: AMP-binding protein [Acidimicrobiales bacterium]